MPRSPIVKHKYINNLADMLEIYVAQFSTSKSSLEKIFVAMESWIADEDTPVAMVAELETKHAQGLALIQNMLDNHII